MTIIYRMCRSEEDNDPLTDDGQPAGAIAITRSTQSAPRAAHGKQPTILRPRHHLAQHLTSDSDSVDSPTYDGDIESSTTAGADTPSRPAHIELSPPTTPVLMSVNIPDGGDSAPRSSLPVFISPPVNTAATPLLVTEEPAVAHASKTAFNPAALTPEDIQTFVAKAIEGEPGRKYTINAPPTDRPVRIYADGTYPYPCPRRHRCPSPSPIFFCCPTSHSDIT